MKHRVSSQNARWRTAWCRVASSDCKLPGTRGASAGPCKAQACSGATTSICTRPITTKAPRQPKVWISNSQAGNDKVLAKPPTSVTAVMPSR